MATYLNNADFSKTVIAFKKKPTKKKGQQLASNLKLLSENILRYAKFKLFDEHEEAIVRRCIYQSFDSIEKYKDNQRAFNFFTTVILNQCRKEYRRLKAEDIQARKYQKFLA